MNAPHRDNGFFTETLASRDPELFGSITQELGRQRHEIELIASASTTRPPAVVARMCNGLMTVSSAKASRSVRPSAS